MRVRHKFILILTIVIIYFCRSSIIKGFDNNDNYIKEYKDSIYGIAKMMRCIPSTGDLDLDYLYQMDFFCEGEVNFSNAYIGYATNDDIKNIAKKCIEREGIQIEKIKSLIEKNKDNLQVNKEEEEKYLKIYNQILSNMMCSFQKVELTEDINVDYLRFILIHHNGVIEITEKFLDISDNKEVTEIAQKILNEMKQDVDMISKYI